MKIFEPFPLGNFELAQPRTDDGFVYLRDQLNGGPIGRNWVSPMMKLVRECVEHGQLSATDAPWLGAYTLVLKYSAVEKLGSFLRDYGELLSMRCTDSDLYAYNVTMVIDALDAQRADIAHFKDGGVMRIRRYAFRSEIVADAGIFKIPTLCSSPMFFSERAVGIWNNAGIAGIAFKEIWKE